MIAFVVSVFPIYFAYVLFGVINFSQYSKRFVSFDAASVSLFSLVLPFFLYFFFLFLRFLSAFNFFLFLFLYFSIISFVTFPSSFPITLFLFPYLPFLFLFISFSLSFAHSPFMLPSFQLQDEWRRHPWYIQRSLWWKLPLSYHRSYVYVFFRLACDDFNFECLYIYYWRYFFFLSVSFLSFFLSVSLFFHIYIFEKNSQMIRCISDCKRIWKIGGTEK